MHRSGDNLIRPHQHQQPPATVAGYSCFTGSQPSIKLGGRPPGFQRAKRAQAVATREERNDGLLQGLDESIGAGPQLGKLTLRTKLDLMLDE